ncbi:peptidyl-prolyl cis-trans isomerase SurA [Rhodoblastus acidophilus]|uniref:peptidylprolyl isomerase n=1 Tax=Rhodoblastus acidophilus TaxID=1074 RepID=UPI002223F5B6|nr:peptidylprolyl isomerase [Rhodoblastus acidophilus]MCW2285068.1 peptidyl-prolyl cis-trans isomerase SurA [Rhodoblastus acidophilus]MCW2334074.1 peptidyl-prolyl cis-trans isomerase SurA [Rhodoblastus acidophilus]
MARSTVFAGAMLALMACSGAHAQSIVATINGDPVTTQDIANREKVLRALGMPSSASDALESLVKSRVEAGEVNKYGIRVKNDEIGPTLYYFAERLHTTPQALQQRLAQSGADSKHLENFLQIHQAFTIYARARNRAVEVSEKDIDAEIARSPKLSNEMTYTLRQVVVAAPPSSGAAGLQAAAKEMQDLKARFTDCDSGVKMASASPNVVVREPITRTSSALGEQLADLLNKTPVGHLTAPSRDSTGLVAIAVCDKSKAKGDSARDQAAQRVLSRRISEDAEKLYKELRATAVVVKK